MPLDLPIQTQLCTKCTPSWPQHSLMAVAHLAGPCDLMHSKTAQEQLEEQKTECKVMTCPPNFPDPSPIKHLWDVLIHGGPILQHTGPKWSTTNVPMPDTSGYPQRSHDHALTGLSCFGCTKWTCTILDGCFYCQSHHVFFFYYCNKAVCALVTHYISLEFRHY